jgi:hypothetical protein
MKRLSGSCRMAQKKVAGVVFLSHYGGKPPIKSIGIKISIEKFSSATTLLAPPPVRETLRWHKAGWLPQVFVRKTERHDMN